MKFNKQQRAKIYRELAEKYDGGYAGSYTCGELINLLNPEKDNTNIEIKKALEEFPEFRLFSPTKRLSYHIWWELFPYFDYINEREQRVLALLFCEQMCK